MKVYDFKIAKVAEDELENVLESQEPTGEYKIIYAMCDDYDEACRKVEEYVAQTKYDDIENKKIIK
jgi:hypothetical protein